MKALKSAVKSVLHSIHKRRRESELHASVVHVTSAQLQADLRGLGLLPGDVVWVHSSLKSLGYVEGGAKAVIDALWQSIQPGGTLVIPAYYMLGTILGTCQDPDYVFDPRAMGSNLGAISDTVLKWPGVRRSIHPTHSIAAIGPLAQDIVGDHHRARSAFGQDSPWQRFTAINGKLMGLGISLGPVTYYHHIEDMLGDDFPVEVGYPRRFDLRCVDFEGRPLTVPVTPFNPDLMPVRIDHPSQQANRDAFWAEFTARGILHTGPVGQSVSWWMHSQEAFDAICDMARHDRTVYALPEGAPQRRRPAGIRS